MARLSFQTDVQIGEHPSCRFEDFSGVFWKNQLLASRVFERRFFYLFSAWRLDETSRCFSSGLFVFAHVLFPFYGLWYHVFSLLNIYLEAGLKKSSKNRRRIFRCGVKRLWQPIHGFGFPWLCLKPTSRFVRPRAREWYFITAHSRPRAEHQCLPLMLRTCKVCFNPDVGPRTRFPSYVRLLRWRKEVLPETTCLL